jgi:hypothetical protein
MATVAGSAALTRPGPSAPGCARSRRERRPPPCDASGRGIRGGGRGGDELVIPEMSKRQRKAVSNVLPSLGEGACHRSARSSRRSDGSGGRCGGARASRRASPRSSIASGWPARSTSAARRRAGPPTNRRPGPPSEDAWPGAPTRIPPRTDPPKPSPVVLSADRGGADFRHRL